MSKYKLIGSKQILEIHDSVKDFFFENRQKEKDPEIGGLLFASITTEKVSILLATPPHKNDLCKNFIFIPNRINHNKLIKHYFKQGLHFVGEWHTHPQREPSPSNIDILSMKDSFSKSKHELNSLVMIIVGNAEDSLRLWVGTHNNIKFQRLKGIKQ